MKQKKWLYAVSLILLVLSSFILLKNLEKVSESEASSRFASSVGGQRERNPGSAEPNEINISSDHQRETQNIELRFAATALPAPPENADAIIYPKYEFGGSSISGSIKDSDGNLIWRATKDNPVFFISPSPDDGKIVVVGGDGKAYIITNEGNKIADLPQFPPGKDMFAFGYWVWLDNQRLLGGSGVEKFDESGKSFGCCDGHDGSESRFYVYDLTTNQIEEMRLPENLRGKVLILPKMLKTGEFQLGHEGEGFGWYKATVTGLGEQTVHKVEKSTLLTGAAEGMGNPKSATPELPEEVLALLPGPITAEDLHGLQPIDTGRMNPSRGMFSLATTIAFLTLGEIDQSQIFELQAVIAKIEQIEFFKGGANGNFPMSFLIARRMDLPPVLRDVENPWLSKDVKPGNHFIIASDATDAEIVDQLQDPDYVQLVDANDVNAILRELTFLKDFNSKPVGQQLALSGLMDYLQNNGTIGAYLGSHLGSLYENNPPSVRPKMLPIIEQLGDDDFDLSGVNKLILHLMTMTWGVTEDSLGAALLLALKGMSSTRTDGMNLEKEQLSLASGIPFLIKRIQHDRDLAHRLMDRTEIIAEVQELKSTSAKWKIKTGSEERSLIEVQSLLDTLEELR